MMPTLVTMEGGEGAIEFVNSSDEEAVVPKSALIGTLHPLRITDLDYFNEEGESIRHAEEQPVKVWKEEIQYGDQLSSAEKEKVKQLIDQYSDVFSKNALDLGQTPLVTHEIQLSDSRPVQIPARRVPPHLQAQFGQGVG